MTITICRCSVQFNNALVEALLSSLMHMFSVYTSGNVKLGRNGCFHCDIHNYYTMTCIKIVLFITCVSFVTRRSTRELYSCYVTVCPRMTDTVARGTCRITLPRYCACAPQVWLPPLTTFNLLLNSILHC